MNRILTLYAVARRDYQDGGPDNVVGGPFFGLSAAMQDAEDRNLAENSANNVVVSMDISVAEYSTVF